MQNDDDDDRVKEAVRQFQALQMNLPAGSSTQLNMLSQLLNQGSVATIITVLDSPTNFNIERYLQTIEKLKPSEMCGYLQTIPSPFARLFDTNEAVAVEKIRILFSHAKRLNLNPNSRIMHSTVVDFAQWDNTPLHFLIAYECPPQVTAFLQFATENSFVIELNAEDKEGKTPLLLAVKMGNVPIEIIKQLITNENYNKPDKNGFTPAMYACALRRLDILKLLLKKHLESVGLGVADVDHLTEQEQKLLSSFINQQHPDNNRSLLHFSVLREGNDLDFSKSRANQSTVINILKSVAIDGRRDSKANKNVINIRENIYYYTLISARDEKGIAKMKQTGLPPHISAMYDVRPNQYELILTDLCYINGKQHPNGLLSSSRNAFAALCKSTTGSSEQIQKTVGLLSTFNGISLSTDIVSRSKAMADFLLSAGANPHLMYTFNGKSFTPEQYISKVISTKEQASSSDISYLSAVKVTLQQSLVCQQQFEPEHSSAASHP